MNRILFITFCIWSFVLLCRPQDIFPALQSLHLAQLLGLLTLLFFIFSSPSPNSFFRDSQLRYYVALFGIMIVGIPFSLYSRLSFQMVINQYSIVIFFSFVLYKIVDSVEKLSIILLVGCLGTGLYTVFALALGDFYSGRLSFGNMFDPNGLAYFSLVFLPLNLIFITKDNPIWLRLISLCFFGSGTLVIIMTGSRGGMVAFVTVFAILLFIKSKVIKPSMKIVFVSICMLFVFNTSMDMGRYLTIFSPKDDYNMTSETGRMAIWSSGIKALMSSPITGVGVGCFGEAVGRDREQRGAKTIRWQTAHNSVVLIATETGFGGLFLFVLISLNILRIFARIRKEATNERFIKIGEMSLLGFTGLFISGLFVSEAYSIYWAFYVTISAVMKRLTFNEM